MSGLLEGVRVVVTGASRGIGRASAIAMVRQGAEVATLARTDQSWTRADEAASRLHAFVADVGDPDVAHEVCEQVRARLGGIDVLVNNAGVPGPEGPLWTIDPREAAWCLAVNTLGPFHMMRNVLPSMVARGRGVVINVSSGAAERPKAAKAWYGASKSALDHLVAAAALDLAGTAVRVHGVHPGPVDTALNHANRRGADDAERARLRPPSEVAALVTWLASAQGAAVGDQRIVRWREAPIKDRLRAMPGFPQPVPGSD